MPRTKRDNIKRMWAQARYHMALSGTLVKQLQEIFVETHPDYAALAEYVQSSLMMSIDGWEAFGRNAWGRIPENLDSWRV